MQKALNSLTPEDIFIRRVEPVSETFHARFNVKAKEYVYKINMGEYDPIERNYVYQYNKKLDVVEMERALKYLEGEHDFKSFSKADEEKEEIKCPKCNNIIELDWNSEDEYSCDGNCSHCYGEKVAEDDTKYDSKNKGQEDKENKDEDEDM